MLENDYLSQKTKIEIPRVKRVTSEAEEFNLELLWKERKAAACACVLPTAVDRLSSLQSQGASCLWLIVTCIFLVL